MSTNDSRSDDGRPDGRAASDDNEQDADRGRYDDLEVGNGDVVIYDTENHRAWIQSDDAVATDSKA